MSDEIRKKTGDAVFGTPLVKRGLAEMMRGGVIMDVTNPEQAKIAERAGACAVMALEKIPADIRKEGGVARMSDPSMIESIMKSVSVPVMAKCRIGHSVEASVLQNLGVDFIDESEVLTIADNDHYISKWDFKVPFVCGSKDLSEALRRISEGAAMIRTKGEAGTGNILEAVRHLRTIRKDISVVKGLEDDEVFAFAKEKRCSVELLREIRKEGRLPVVNFAAGGVATPADAALCMRLGADGVFVGSGIFKSSNPEKLAKAIVQAVTHFQDDNVITEVSKGLGPLMKGIASEDIQVPWASKDSG